jgi:hypothetical protein
MAPRSVASDRVACDLGKCTKKTNKVDRAWTCRIKHESSRERSEMPVCGWVPSIRATGVGVVCALLLAGCNIVVSSKPVFTATDIGRPPVLKPGLWAEHPPCAPAAGPRSPPCVPPLANYRITADDMTELSPPSAPFMGGYASDAGADTDASPPGAQPQRPPAGVDPRADYVLASGAPPVAQLRVTGPLTREISPELYLYVAFTPTGRDRSGRIISAIVWPVPCGPPSSIDRDMRDGVAFSTRHPSAGLSIGPGSACTPKNGAAVLNAARRGLGWARLLMVLYWIGDAPAAPQKPH